MSDFKEFFEELKNNLIVFTKNSWKDYKSEAVSDVEDFVTLLKNDLEKWTRSLVKGNLSKKDFSWLLEGQKDLAKLEKLRLQGIAMIKLDEFVNGLIDTIVSTVFRIIPSP